MAYLEEEIVKELVVGTIYTEREISSLVAFKHGVIVLCSDTSDFHPDNREIKYIVTNKSDTYIHENKDGSYHINPNKKTVYNVKRS
jgi:hypothetical protein